MDITVKKEDILSIVEEISGIVTTMGYLDDSDDIEDVWYYAEQIKTQLFFLTRVIDEAAPVKGEKVKP